MERRQKSSRMRGKNKLVLLQPPKKDHTHTIIIALATIVSALIVAKRI